VTASQDSGEGGQTIGSYGVSELPVAPARGHVSSRGSLPLYF
jgi:hypothetical protein